MVSIAPSDPYGTCLHLSSDQCRALGITSPPPAGAVFTIQAKGVAQSVTEHLDGPEAEVCLTLQITDMELTPGASGESAAEGPSMASILYGD